MEPEIECTECGWQGDRSELVCSDDDARIVTGKSVDDISFNICPDCGSADTFEDYED